MGRERVPEPRQLFGLSVAVVESADNLTALDLAVEACTALLEELSPDSSWEQCRGQLETIREFAWLLGRTQTSSDMGADAQGTRTGGLSIDPESHGPT